MPNVSSPLGTNQRYIPAVAPSQIARYAGLHMHFVDMAALNTAVADERLNITDTSPIWANGQPISVATEPTAVIRNWDASAQHARKVTIRPGLVVTLAADANTVREGAGAPGAGVGANGDISIDWAGNAYYTKAGGTWSSTGSIYSGGGSTTMAGLTDVETYDLVANNDSVAQAISSLGTGKADLSGGKVPASQLPDSLFGGLNFQGGWNANTNSPTIPAASTANDGHFYKVTTSGSTSINGISDWVAGDWIWSDGTVWNKVDNTESGSGAVAPRVLVDGDFTAGSLTLAASDLNRMLYLNTTGTKTIVLANDVGLGSPDNNALLMIHNKNPNSVKLLKGTATLRQADGKADGVVLPQDVPMQFMHTDTDTWTQTSDVGGLEAIFDTSFSQAVTNGLGSTNGVTSLGLVWNSLDSCVTSTAATVADGTGEYAATPRSRFQTQAAAVNRVAGGYSSTGNMRLNTPRGRFPMVAQVGVADALTGATLFVGIHNVVAADFRTAEPDTFNNSLGFHVKSTDTNIFAFSRTSGGAVVRVDTGIPATQWNRMRFYIDKSDDGTVGFLKMKNIDSGACWPTNGTYHTVASGDMPQNTQTYYPYAVRSSMANAALAALDFMRVTFGRP